MNRINHIILQKTALIFLILIIPLIICSYSSFYKDGKELQKITGAFYALSVRNVDTVAVWYSSNLGFSIDRKGELVKGGPKFALLRGHNIMIELGQFKTAKSRSSWGLPEMEVQDVYGIFKIGFEIKNLDEMYAAAKDKGLTILFPIVRPQGASYRTFGLKDPENNIVQFFGE